MGKLLLVGESRIHVGKLHVVIRGIFSFFFFFFFFFLLPFGINSVDETLNGVGGGKESEWKLAKVSYF